ncbi:MAG: fatty acid desaturase [Cyanobacteria bacterium P01_F01_bin.13]
MNKTTSTGFIPQSVYAKKLRPLLPKDAFQPDPSKLVILFINMAILLLGWSIASYLDRWPKALLWLYLPCSLVMANCVILLAFLGHDLMHGSVIRRKRLVYITTLFSQSVLWIPPTLWKNIHNRVHHNKTNSLEDPDRNYLYEEPNAFGKWAQDFLVPSSTVTLPGLLLGMAIAWGVYGCRHLIAVLFFDQKDCPHVTAQVSVKPGERHAIAAEFIFILLLHFSILAYLHFNPLKLILAYFLPIGLGYAGMIFYIYTNHMFCPMTSVNDPLVNSVSVKVPKFLDLIHFNFSYHAEHHIFPGLNSDYYPLVREYLAQLYPERMGYVVCAKEAWRLLLTTPRHYLDETTFTDLTGKMRVPCPF